MGESPSWGSSQQLIPVNISRALAFSREQSIVELSLFCLSLILAVQVISFFPVPSPCLSRCPNPAG